MAFAELYEKCRNGDTKACETLHIYHYLIPQVARIFKRFNLEPPVVLPMPWPQPDPVPFERLVGEARLFDELARHTKIANLTAPFETQLKTLKSLKSEISEWSNEIEKDIQMLETKMSSKGYSVSDI